MQESQTEQQPQPDDSRQQSGKLPSERRPYPDTPLQQAGLSDQPSGVRAQEVEKSLRSVRPALRSPRPGGRKEPPQTVPQGDILQIRQSYQRV